MDSPLVFFASVFGGGVLMSMLMSHFLFPNDAAENRLCDQAVAALVHSKDAVEIQRAGIIIHEVGCAIGRRFTDLEEPSK